MLRIGSEWHTLMRRFAQACTHTHRRRQCQLTNLSVPSWHVHQLNRFTQIARAAIGCVVIGHYPLNAHPARVGLEHLESYFLGWKHISRGLGLLQTVGFVAVTLGIALVVSC